MNAEQARHERSADAERARHGCGTPFWQIVRQKNMEEMEPLIATAIALFAGLMMTRVFKLFHWNFPDVTAYLLAGLVVGPYCLGRLGIPGVGFKTFEQLDKMAILSDAALGFIAFSIGEEFRLTELRKIGKQAAIIGIVQAVVASAFVDAVLVLLHFVLGNELLPISVCLTLGAIAAATAPAATLMVVRQYKADGPLTRLLLPIVALDDAVGLVIFAVSFGIAQALEGGALSTITIVVEPIVEIVASLVLGGVMGAVLSLLEKLFYSNTNRLAMTISFVFLTISLAAMTFKIGAVEVSFSSLLVCMTMGTVFCNMSQYSEDIFHRAERWTAPLYAVFFVLSGAELELSVFRNPSFVLLGVVFVLARAFGKYSGATITAKAMHCDKNVCKYLGYTLFPEAGVALGMLLTAQTLGDEEGLVIRNVVLFAVMVYELTGPSITKWALTKAGEIKPQTAAQKSRDRFEQDQEKTTA
ncbi:MAG: cation:proton antiporter [Eubacterium sp.]